MSAFSSREKFEKSINKNNEDLTKNKNIRLVNSMADFEFLFGSEMTTKLKIKAVPKLAQKKITKNSKNSKTSEETILEKESLDKNNNSTIKNQIKLFEEISKYPKLPRLPDTNKTEENNFFSNKKYKIIEQDFKKLEEKLEKELDSENFLQYHYEPLEKETKVNLMREQNEIKKLEMWDQDHLENHILENEGLLKSIRMSSNNKSKALRKEMESINSLNLIKENISKLSLNFSNKTFNEFAKKAEKEQGIILLQNIAVSKRKFNFDIFTPKEIIAIQSDLNVDFNEIRDETINVDSYRQIIKEKSKLETKYRRELFDIAHRIFEKKLEKQKLEEINLELFKELYECRKENDMRKERLESEKLSLDRQYNGSINAILNESNILSHGKKLTSALMYEQEEKLKISTIFNRKMDAIEKKMKDLKMAFDNVRNKFNKIIEDNRQSVLLVEQEQKYLKNIFNNLIKDQKMYYLEILYKGIDVRGEGLVWVVKRLLEMEMPLDYSLFPKFVDHNQVEFLMKSAKIHIQSFQMKILLKSLKERQKRIREKDNGEMLMRASLMGQKQIDKNKRNTIFHNADPCSFVNDTNNTNNAAYLSNKTLQRFETISKKYENLTKNTFDQKTEEIQVKSIVDSLRNKILKYSNDDKALEDEDRKDEYSIVKYFMKHEKQKEYFEEIMYLRSQIQILDDLLEKTIREEKKSFQKKYDQFKNLNARSSVQYDLLWAALFGNSITV